MSMLYSLYYKQFGIRRLQGLMSPRLIAFNSLPRNSLVHFTPDADEGVDVDTSKLYFQGQARTAFVGYTTELTSKLGNPVRKNLPILNLVNPFHAANRNFRYARNGLELVKDVSTICVQSYGHLSQLYRYPDLPMTPYNKWFNTQKTLWDTVDSLATSSTRNQFVFIGIPKDLLSLSIMNLYVERENVAMLKIFDTPEELFFLQLWKWLSVEHRGTSVFSGLKETNYNKVNFVFMAPDSRCAIMNMGYLNNWIKGTNKVAMDDKSMELTSDQIQKLFLKFMMTLQSSVPAEAIPGEDETPIVTDLDPDLEDTDTPETDAPQSMPVMVKSIATGKSEEETVQDDIDLSKIDDAELETNIASQLKEIDEELKALDFLSSKKLQNKGLKIDAKTGEETTAAVEEEIPLETIVAKIYGDQDYEQALRASINANADYGLLTAANYRKHLGDLEKYKVMPDPYGSGKPTIQAMVVTKEDLELNTEKMAIVSNETILDPSMLESSLKSFDEDYIGKVIKKDTLAVFNSIQRAGIVIRGHEIENDHSALGSFEIHTVTLSPIDGMPSTVRIRLPKVNNEATFVNNGVKYTLRKQRTDVPIRKTGPSEVALTSYYGKNFVTLSPKKTNSSVDWLVRQLNIASMEEHPFLTKISPAMVYDNNFTAPFIYNALAANFKSLKAGSVTLSFDHSSRTGLATPEVLKKIEVKGNIVAGVTDKGLPVYVDVDDKFFVYETGVSKPLGDIYSVLQLNRSKAPVDFSEVKIFSKVVPVGIVLAYAIGFKNLIRLLKTEVRVVDGKRIKDLADDEFAIQFEDKSFIFSRDDKVASMILAGFNDYEKLIKKFKASDFETKDVYMNLLESKGLGAIYMREIDLTMQLFVDPITKGILEEMKEPVTYTGLLIRATELLQTYHHPDSQDTRYVRFRGYERLPGAVYKQLVIAIRQYRNKNIAGRSKIDMSPYQVWTAVMKDPSIKVAEDINPIQNLKELESVTYVGEGGRSKESMNKESRAYHVEDMGVISESTVDSSDVGVNTYLSANPNFTGVRGLVKTDKMLDATNLLSTSTLLSPGAMHDDPKRVMFIPIQQAHTVPADGYRQPYLGTGYESIMAHRTSSTFAQTARESGKVISVTEEGVIIETADGKQTGYAVGRVYGRAEGTVYPHDIVTPLKVGQKFVKGDVLTYNTGFFEPDFLDPRRVVMKSSMVVKTALFESLQTHEDASSLSKKLSVQMTTRTTKVKSITVTFQQNLVNVLKPGTQVKPKDILAIIEDEITAGSNAFDEESLAVLQGLSSQAPKAGYLGSLDRIEVYYHGDKRDMSASIKLLADRSDRLLASIAKSTAQTVITGQVTDEYRVAGTPLGVDKAEIKFYITVENKAGVGD